ncbi:unnamed protein product, partial [Effrenium voratum]
LAHHTVATSMGDTASLGSTSPHGRYAPVSGASSPIRSPLASSQHVEFVPVGANLGSYVKEKLPIWGIRMECLCLGLCILLSSVLFFVYLLVSQHMAAVGHSEADDLSVSSAAYDCAAGFWNRDKGWSDAKKQYCCQHLDRGCETSTTPPPYDCNAAFNNWQFAWSEPKKLWCCDHFEMGCTNDNAGTYTCTDSLIDTWSMQKRMFCCQSQRIGCMAAGVLHYDCKAGFANWKQGWSADKKAWCCHHDKVACPTVAPYDCDSHYERWKTAWSILKQRYCGSLSDGMRTS